MAAWSWTSSVVEARLVSITKYDFSAIEKQIKTCFRSTKDQKLILVASFLLFVQQQRPQTAAEVVSVLHFAAEFLRRRVLLNEALLSVHDSTHAGAFLFKLSDTVLSIKRLRLLIKSRTWPRTNLAWTHFLVKIFSRSSIHSLIVSCNWFRLLWNEAFSSSLKA